jgi:cyanophycinase
VVDGSNVETDAFYTKAHRPMMVSGAILHSLPNGYRFDLKTRTLLPPVTDLTPKAQRIPQIERKRMRSLAREIAAEGANSFFADRRRKLQREPEASE